MLEIKNDGRLIVATNFWSTEMAQKGFIYMSINAGAFRVLLPQSRTHAVDEMQTAEYVIVTRGTWYRDHDAPRKDSFEILFEDGSNNPYCLHIVKEQVDRIPLEEDEGRTDLRCLVYTFDQKRGIPILVLDRPARYRRAKRLPYLKKWGVAND